MARKIRGVLPVAHTPLDQNDAIDWESLRRQIDWAFDTGADGYCTGMVSELLRLTPAEREQLTAELADMNEQRGVFVASVGAESTKQAVAYARQAEAAGCDGVMAIPPMTCPLPAEEILDYFSALAHAVSLPIIVQDASGYVGRAIPHSVYLELLERFGADRILFKPEAPPIGPRLSQLRDATSGAAQILEGSGGNLLVDSYRRGIVGTIPGMEFLDGVVALWRALQQGDEAVAYRIYFPICALVALQLQAGLDGFLAVEKFVLYRRGLFATPARRRPNGWTMDRETEAEVIRLLDQLQLAIDRGPQ